MSRRTVAPSVGIAALTVFTAVDVYYAYADEERDDSASEAIRSTIRRHPIGIHIFTTAWAAFAVWLWAHVVHNVRAPLLREAITAYRKWKR